MAEQRHGSHPHQHARGCEHRAITHEGHVDYLHDGHLHHQNGGTVEEHRLAVGGANPAACTPGRRATPLSSTAPSRACSTPPNGSAAAAAASAEPGISRNFGQVAHAQEAESGTRRPGAPSRARK